MTGNVEILPEIPAISAEAKRLKNQGVNILIALGHSGFEMDIKIAENVEDIDLVVGGHTNTFLYTGEYPYCDDNKLIIIYFIGDGKTIFTLIFW